MRNPIVVLALVLLTLLGALAAKSLLVQPPSLRAHQGPGEFDAARAKQRLAYILGDQRPHPADTPASDLVRGRLVAQLQQLGHQPIIRDQFACNELYKQRGVSCARVRNVIVVLSGPPSGKALLLNAHYDSTPTGPGAADDGIGVATLLEVAKVLPGEPLSERRVILLFNEGEELGLVGARAFLADPLGRNVDSIINLEARGVRGPVNMFETSRPNAAPISVFAGSVKNPIANSLSTDVYRLLPNYTDVNSFNERGWLTLNLAPIGNETRYHSPGDDVGSLDPATLQHMGDQTLAMAEKLNSGAPKTSGERIFMDLAGRTLVTLPLFGGVVLLMGLLIAFAFLSLQRGGLLRSSVAIVGSVTAATILSWLILTLIGAVRHGMFWRAHPIWTHLTVYAATTFAASVLLALVGNSLDRNKLRPAFWFVFLVIGGAIGLIAPGGIIFFIFPPLLSIVGMLGSRWWQPAERIGSYAAILFLYLTWGAMLGLLEELLNGGPMWIFAPLGSLLIIPVLIEVQPLIVSAGFRSAGLAGAILTLIGIGAMVAVPAYSADREQRFVMQHVTDVTHGKSWWSILNDGAPLPNGFSGQWRRGELPFSDRPRWLSAAPANAVARAPDIQLLSQVQSGNERTLMIKLLANGNEHVDLIAPPDAKIRAAGIGGFVRPIDQNEEGKYFLDCFGRSCDGATMEITLGTLQPVEFTILGGTAALPPSAAPLLAARPRFAWPQYNRDESIVFSTRRL